MLFVLLGALLYRHNDVLLQNEANCKYYNDVPKHVYSTRRTNYVYINFFYLLLNNFYLDNMQLTAHKLKNIFKPEL